MKAKAERRRARCQKITWRCRKTGGTITAMTLHSDHALNSISNQIWSHANLCSFHGGKTLRPCYKVQEIKDPERVWVDYGVKIDDWVFARSSVTVTFACLVLWKMFKCLFVLRFHRYVPHCRQPFERILFHNDTVQMRGSILSVSRCCKLGRQFALGMVI